MRLKASKGYIFYNLYQNYSDVQILTILQMQYNSIFFYGFYSIKKISIYTEGGVKKTRINLKRRYVFFLK